MEGIVRGKTCRIVNKFKLCLGLEVKVMEQSRLIIVRNLRSGSQQIVNSHILIVLIKLVSWIGSHFTDAVFPDNFTCFVPPNSE